jgi:hypothetical protein
MQPRHNSDVQRSSHEARQPLPAEVAERLTPTYRHALMHGLRRRVLRAFIEDPVPKTAKDLAPAFPGVTLQTINYHVFVLAQCGSLVVSRGEQTQGTLARSFVANVVDDAEVVGALRATEQLDDV